MRNRWLETLGSAALAFVVLLGQVKDETTGQPLPNVRITVGAQHTTTDATGHYRLTGLTPGMYTLTATSDDVPIQRRDVTIGKSQTEFNFKLCSTTLDYGCGATTPGGGGK